MPKKPVNYVRKRVDFYPDIEYDKKLIETFFEKERFLHSELSNVPLSHSDVLKAALHYFYKNVIAEEQNIKILADKYKKKVDSLEQEVETIRKNKSEEIEGLNREISSLKEKALPRHASSLKREVMLE